MDPGRLLILPCECNTARFGCHSTNFCKVAVVAQVVSDNEGGSSAFMLLDDGTGRITVYITGRVRMMSDFTEIVRVP